MRPCKAVCILVVLCFMAGAANAQNKYIGVQKCKACHKVEKLGGLSFAVWEKSKHAAAFETLKSKEAEEIAKKKGLKKPAAESPECLKCHVTGGGEAKNTEASFKKQDGVTCEACHGAASAFVNIHNKDKAKAKEAGLIKGDKTSEKACVVCHNAESPTYKGFKMAEMWAKIEHKGPTKK